MTNVTVDKVQAEALVRTVELVEIKDPPGSVIGFFAPLKMEYAEQYAEMAARAYAAYRDGRRPLTTTEVITHLESLEKAQ